MKSPFFSRRLPYLPRALNVALLLLLVIFLTLPFAFRGARFGLQQMKNNVKDWLPADFPETRELDWFREHFLGEQFVLASWPGAMEGAPTFEEFVRLLENEIEPQQAADTEPQNESEKARQIGRDHGLHYVGDVHLNWGGQDEKWLRGFNNKWYYITPQGKLFRWNVSDNLAGWAARSLRRYISPPKLDGELIATFEMKTDGGVSVFYQDPQKLTARLFKSVNTGPKVVEQLAGRHGWLRREAAGFSDLDKAKTASRIAMSRLNGALFGPAPPAEFDWTLSSFINSIPEEIRAEFPANWQSEFRRHLATILENYGGVAELRRAKAEVKAAAWRELFEHMSPAASLLELPEEFSWTVDSFRRAAGRAVLARLPKNWESRFRRYVDDVVKSEFEGDQARIRGASYERQEELWHGLFYAFRIIPPQRTCVIVTLSDVGREHLQWVVGRRLMGRPQGRIQELAAQCGISSEVLNLGGPPVDNVAIDEEGQITLVRLIGFSAIIGLVLAWFAFRSVKVTIMVFFVGVIAAVASISAVWWTGQSVDAVLLSMPSLVYVLGLSGAIHILNYYREASQESGPAGAPEKALAHGWRPCALAAFTTAIGLLSLFTSNIIPIRKFGLFSALGVVGTLVLLFAFLPSVLTLWPVRFRGGNGPASRTKLEQFIQKFWDGVCSLVTRRSRIVSLTCICVLLVVGFGLTKINTSIQLLKLFDPNAKIIHDYTALETNLAKLVPMEVVLRFEPRSMLSDDPHEIEASRFGLNLLERMEAADRIHQVIEQEFGPEGQDVVGRALSAPTFSAQLPGSLSAAGFNRRTVWNQKLDENKDKLLATDYLRIDKSDQSELWRISVRLGALNQLDYGEFVDQFKSVVEPVLSAFQHRDEILRAIDQRRGGRGFAGQSILLLTNSDGPAPDGSPDQSRIFSETLGELLDNANLIVHRQPQFELADRDNSDRWKNDLQSYACVVAVEDAPKYDWSFIRNNARMVVDARDHRYDPSQMTANEKEAAISAVYTGLVPIVYKAQRTLMTSLIESIGWAFVLIALVMMILLRNWRRKWSLDNAFNVRAGLVSMLPNVFPVVIIFGAMGWMGVSVDIGSMMTASVAMGVAVDDTIHFLTWFRNGMERGLNRNDAIREAYRRVAMAMTQTTLIGGLGLSVFALSTFTPTQRFGVLMVSLLACALVGDLVMLPALLAGPLGKFFVPKGPRPAPKGPSRQSAPLSVASPSRQASKDQMDETAQSAIRLHCPHDTSAGIRHDSRLAPKT